MLVADPIAPSGERVKVLDFGIAKLLNKDEQGGVRTNTQAVMGTPMYMSPEQCAGAGRVDAKSDVYSPGCVLFQLLAGRPPFIAEGIGRLLGMHLYEEPPPLSLLAPTAPADVCVLVHQLLLKESQQRPGMAEAAAALGCFLATLGGPGSAFQGWPPQSAPDATPATLIQVPQKQPTTLGQSLGQLNKRKIKWRLMLWAGPAGLLLSAAVAIGWQAHARDGTRYVPQVRATAPSSGSPATPLFEHPPMVPSKIRRELDRVPNGDARLDERSDQPGQTPSAQELPAHAGTVKLRMHSRGNQDEVRELNAPQNTNRPPQLRRFPPAKSLRAKPLTAPAVPMRPLQSSQPSDGKIYEE